MAFSCTMGAIRIDMSALPLLVIEFQSTPTDAEFRNYLATMEALWSQHRFIGVVIDVLTSGMTPRAQQKMQAEWMRRHRDLLAVNSVTAFVFHSPALRFVLSAILLIQHMPHPYVVVGTREEAIEWALARIRQHERAAAVLRRRQG